jgi:hypothetical protein
MYLSCIGVKREAANFKWLRETVAAKARVRMLKRERLLKVKISLLSNYPKRHRQFV